MAYVGLARKWRPQTFDDLAGQQHIAQTLMNAIKTGRIGQGYLFTGTRGVGKTSSARIFAKAIRCPHPTAPAVPCNQCQDCAAISEGKSIDVLEIDGASHNGVDAVREIRDNAKYLPSTGKYKIYIIDEVHMLTTAAFNALLKTLEEPPPHLVFLFATTDVQKIPATILSRCQRFDFRRVAQKDLSERLQHICSQEGIRIEDAALATLVREAEGSLRDGISLLDQVYGANQGEAISLNSLSQALGLIDKSTILNALWGILNRDALKALDAAGQVHLHGFELKQFGKELLRYLRLLMVIQLLEKNKTSASTLLDISDVDLADLKKLSGIRSQDDLDMLFCLLNHGLEDLARSTIPKMILDVLLMKMCAAAELVPLSFLKAASDVTPVKMPVFHPNPVPKAAATQTQPPNQAATSTPPPAQVSASAPTQVIASDSPDFWTRFVKAVKSQKPLIGTILENATYQSIVDQGGNFVLALGFSKDQSFYRDQLQNPSTMELLQPALKTIMGKPLRFEFNEVASTKSIEAVEKERRTQEFRKRQQSILESEAMRAAQEVLGGRLDKLEIRGSSLTKERGAEKHV